MRTSLALQRRALRLTNALEEGESYSFGNWPVEAIPRIAAGVYTVWRYDMLIYVGMAGRGKTEVEFEEKRRDPKSKPSGLFQRLGSHASGRRSGDQFCVYICDRFVIPTLNANDLLALSRNEISLDDMTRNWIRKELAFRFVETSDGKTAAELERRVQFGALDAGKPFLNGRE